MYDRVMAMAYALAKEYLEDSKWHMPESPWGEDIDKKLRERLFILELPEIEVEYIPNNKKLLQ